MSVPAIHALFARIVASAAELRRNRARARRHAEVTLYLEGMPDYLRRDIGLTGDVSFAAIVDHGLASAMPDREPCRDLTMTPHAA